MIQRREQIRFASETRAPFGITREELGQNLEGDFSRQVAVACPIHFSHAAGTDERDDLVGSQTDAGRDTHDVPAIISSVH
jgi:hypothetical protein